MVKFSMLVWHAINYENGDVIAYILDYRKVQYFKKLTALIINFSLNVSCVYTDDNLPYHEVIPRNILKIGKQNTHKTERKHLTFRSRLKCLARETICYSKYLGVHTILFGILVNFPDFAFDIFRT